MANDFNYKIVSDSESPYEDCFEEDRSQAVLLIDVAWKELGKIIPKIVGYPKVVQVTSPAGRGFGAVIPALRRVLPMQHPHPDYSDLYATKVAGIKGRLPQGKKTSTVGNYDSYTTARLTVLFQKAPYAMLTDAQVGNQPENELKRFCIKTSQTTVEMITTQVAQFQYYNAAAPNAYPGGANMPFNQGRNRLLQQTELQWLWKNVPYRPGIITLAGADGDPPPNMAACYGKVNNATFMGYPAETLLMMPAKITPKLAPVLPTVLGRNANEAALLADVLITMKHFDPDRPSGYTAGRGHNVFPSPLNNYFYLATVGGGAENSATAPTNTFYQFADFRTFFTFPT